MLEERLLKVICRRTFEIVFVFDFLISAKLSIFDTYQQQQAFSILSNYSLWRRRVVIPNHFGNKSLSNIVLQNCRKFDSNGTGMFLAEISIKQFQNAQETCRIKGLEQKAIP